MSKKVYYAEGTITVPFRVELAAANFRDADIIADGLEAIDVAEYAQLDNAYDIDVDQVYDVEIIRARRRRF